MKFERKASLKSEIYVNRCKYALLRYYAKYCPFGWNQNKRTIKNCLFLGLQVSQLVRCVVDDKEIYAQYLRNEPENVSTHLCDVRFSGEATILSRKVVRKC